jgi:hypothetical protein
VGYAAAQGLIQSRVGLLSDAASHNTNHLLHGFFLSFLILHLVLSRSSSVTETAVATLRDILFRHYAQV